MRVWSHFPDTCYSTRLGVAIWVGVLHFDFVGYHPDVFPSQLCESTSHDVTYLTQKVAGLEGMLSALLTHFGLPLSSPKSANPSIAAAMPAAAAVVTAATTASVAASSSVPAPVTAVVTTAAVPPANAGGPSAHAGPATDADSPPPDQATIGACSCEGGTLALLDVSGLLLEVMSAGWLVVAGLVTG